MKKAICVLLSILFLFSFVSCDSETPSDDSFDTDVTTTSPEQEPEIESEAESEIVTEPKSETEAKTEPETEAATEVKPETEAVTESKPETEPETETETETEAVTEAETETETEAETEATPLDPNVKVNLIKALEALLSNYKWNPKSIIPTSMTPEAQSKKFNQSDLPSSYSSFVSTSDIPENGIGEQWNMVIENIEEAQIFFNTLSVIDGISTASVAAFNNYLDTNPEDTAHYEFESGIYSVAINCTEDKIAYVIEYAVSLPKLGEQTIQIALFLDTETQVKRARVGLGDLGALAYAIDGSSYSLALEYLNTRHTYFDFIKNSDGSVNGHVYEYVTVSSVQLSSIADFYINDDYITVVGNKADGLVGFTGSICELYSADDGKMLAYEVKEELTAAGVGVTYNTMWFDLEDISGISSIKYVPKTSDTDAAFFINNSSSAWEAKKYGLSGGLKTASRRFDLEFRTQYFYYFDTEDEKYKKIAVDIPMLFVQEEVFSDLSKDVKNTNDVEIFVTLNEKHINKLNSEYASKVDILTENKKVYTVEAIKNYIGSQIVFD